MTVLCPEKPTLPQIQCLAAGKLLDSRRGRLERVMALHFRSGLASDFPKWRSLPVLPQIYEEE
jgi:hypothetical protein